MAELSAYEPSWREYLQGLAMQGVGMLGGGTEAQKRAYHGAGTVIDFVPFVGDATAANEAYRDFIAGDYGSAALGGVSAAAGLIPGVGDAAGAAIKGLKNAPSSILGVGGVPYIAKGVPGDLPVHPDIARYADPEIPGLSLTTTPLQRMFHGTNTRSAYDQPRGGLYDVGLHLTRSPGVSAFYSTNLASKNPDLIDQVARGEVPASVLAGPRTYPMLVDPGKTYRGFVDPVNWNDPRSVAGVAESHYDQWDFDELKDMFPEEMAHWPDMMMELDAGVPVHKVWGDRGYDSIEYTHLDPYVEDEYSHNPQGHALLLFDDTRAVPEFSDIGQRAGRARGVLAAQDVDLAGMEDAYLPNGTLNGTSLAFDALMQWLYDPRSIDAKDIKNLVLEPWEQWEPIP